VSAPIPLPVSEPASTAPASAPPRLRVLRLHPAATWPGTEDSQTAPIPGQGSLPLEFCLPNGLPAVPRIPQSVAQHPSPSSIVPWAARLAQAVLEVVAGERPVTQLSSWVAPDIYRRLDRRHQLRTRLAQTAKRRGRCAEQVRSVHVCHPTPDVAEISVVCSNDGRCRGLAIRLERRKGRWVCTELDWP
jgi:hypothetical protein